MAILKANKLTIVNTLTLAIMFFKTNSLGNSSTLLITCKDCRNQANMMEDYWGKKRGIEERLVEKWNRRA